MARNKEVPWMTWCILLLAAVQLALQLSLLARGVEYVTASLTIDDTYYYLQTAWNTKQLGFVTFDGLHATNGVQLLWFVVTVGLAWLAPTKTVLLMATLAVVFLLNALSFLVVLKIGTMLRQPALALVMASLWFLQSLPFRIYSMGMENSLHALVLWCVVWQSTAFLIRVQTGTQPRFAGLTAVLILNAWTRLDSALLSAIVFTVCLAHLAYSYRHNLRLLFETHARAIVGSGTLAGLALAVQLAAFRWMGGSFLPVSAIVKTAGVSRGLGNASAAKLLEVFTLGLPSVLQGRLPAVVLVTLAVMAIVVILRAQMRQRDHSDELSAFMKVWTALLIGELAYYAYVAVSGVQYAPYFIWYRSPSFLFWIMTGCLLAWRLLLAAQRTRWASPVRAWAPVSLSGAAIVVAIYLFARSVSFTSGLYVARYHAALWIRDNSRPDAVFASWNAGQLGYFSDRTVINLDGVINNVDYYQRVLDGPVPLSYYLVENNVDFLVDYTTYAALPDFPVVRVFPLNDTSGRSLHIWQVAAQTSSAQ